MRTIQKYPAPNSLTQWQGPRLAANRFEGMECTYEEMRRVSTVLEAVEDNVFAEQGGICAYTGHRLGLTPAQPSKGIQREANFHIEHLIPQMYCQVEYGTYGKDTEYDNLVACWPRPNCGFEPAYGARKKGGWPSVAEQAQFVSPLRADCSARFAYNHRGEISAAHINDAATNETIDRLGLKHPTLTALRREAIRGTLNPASRPIKLTEARRLLQRMQQDSNHVNQGISTRLMPFCFAIQPALEREIRKLEAILSQR